LGGGGGGGGGGDDDDDDDDDVDINRAWGSTRQNVKASATDRVQVIMS
jgi:hypothetical protein